GSTGQETPFQTVPEWGRLLPIIDTGRTDEDRLSEEEEWAISQLVLGAGESILRYLRRLRYLGPLRTIPDRSYLPPLKADQSRWADGLGAWDALLRSDKKKRLAETCSEYLSETLKVGFALSREERVSIDLKAEILPALNYIASQYDEC